MKPAEMIQFGLGSHHSWLKFFFSNKGDYKAVAGEAGVTASFLSNVVNAHRQSKSARLTRLLVKHAATNAARDPALRDAWMKLFGFEPEEILRRFDPRESEDGTGNG